MKHFLVSLVFFLLFSPIYSQERKVIEKAYPDGKPSLVVFYNTKSEKIREVSYYPNGKVDYEGTFKDGKEHGTWIYYYDDGQKKFEENYKNGVEDGKQYEWEPDGQLTKIEIFKEGKLLKTIPGKSSAH
jgi:antitoxin component YwqK of YwqJK toxin-antitoxin module